MATKYRMGPQKISMATPAYKQKVNPDEIIPAPDSWMIGSYANNLPVRCKLEFLTSSRKEFSNVRCRKNPENSHPDFSLRDDRRNELY